jgi:hypothetical protein
MFRHRVRSCAAMTTQPQPKSAAAMMLSFVAAADA